MNRCGWKDSEKLSYFFLPALASPSVNLQTSWTDGLQKPIGAQVCYDFKKHSGEHLLFRLKCRKILVRTGEEEGQGENQEEGPCVLPLPLTV